MGVVDNTLWDLFALVYFGGFFFKEFVSLLTKFQEVCAGDTCLFDFDENFLADFRGGFEFGESIGIRQRIVLQHTRQSYSFNEQKKAKGEGRYDCLGYFFGIGHVWILPIVCKVGIGTGDVTVMCFK